MTLNALLYLFYLDYVTSILRVYFLFFLKLTFFGFSYTLSNSELKLAKFERTLTCYTFLPLFSRARDYSRTEVSDKLRILL